MMSEQVEKKKAAPWYLKLLEDLKKLIGTENKSIIPIKHCIGKRILEEKESVPYGQVFIFIKELANELEYSWQDLYYCTKFAERYPDLSALLSQFSNALEKLTWRYICQKLLYEQSEKEEKFLKCSLCDSTLPSGDFETFKVCGMCSAEFLMWLQERREKGEGVHKQT
jgi:hypothetical protein